MPSSNSFKRQIEAISLAYQTRYLASLTNALESYLSWRNIHAPGSKWVRFSHFQHGTEGYQNAMELKNLIERAPAAFYDIVESTALVMGKSGFSKHSLKRFIFETFTGSNVVDCIPALTNNDFEELYYETYHDEVARIDQSNPIDFDQLSFLVLTEQMMMQLKILDSRNGVSGVALCIDLCFSLAIMPN